MGTHFKISLQLKKCWYFDGRDLSFSKQIQIFKPVLGISRILSTDSFGKDFAIFRANLNFAKFSYPVVRRVRLSTLLSIPVSVITFCFLAQKHTQKINCFRLKLCFFDEDYTRSRLAEVSVIRILGNEY